jgi:hypothetical protein
MAKETPKGKAATKKIDPNFANLVIKGKSISKSVDPSMAKRQK